MPTGPRTKRGGGVNFAGYEGALARKAHAGHTQGNFLGYFRSLPLWDP